MSELNNTIQDQFNRYLLFSVGPERFAVQLLQVREVISKGEITPVPKSPPYYLGLCKLRGTVLPVFDLRIRLGIKGEPDEMEQSIIIHEMDGQSIGFVVDYVDSVKTIGTQALQDCPQIETTVKRDFLKQIARVDENLVLILDFDLILNPNERKQNSPAQQAA